MILEQEERKTMIGDLKTELGRQEKWGQRDGRNVEERQCCEEQTGTTNPLRLPFWGRDPHSGDTKGYSGTQGFSLNRLLHGKQPESCSSQIQTQDHKFNVVRMR